MKYLQENLHEFFDERLAIMIEGAHKTKKEVILDVMELTLSYAARLGAKRQTALELMDSHPEFNEQVKLFNVRGELRSIRRLLGD